MTQEQHPITPPPELLKQWEWIPRSWAFEAAYRAGADMELEACCEWINREIGTGWGHGTKLRAARRPKPPSLKEQALEALAQVHHAIEQPIAITIRRALDALPDD